MLPKQSCARTYRVFGRALSSVLRNDAVGRANASARRQQSQARAPPRPTPSRSLRRRRSRARRHRSRSPARCKSEEQFFRMTDVTSLIPIAGSEIADFSIAFAKLSVQGKEENAEPAGSG